MDDEALQALRRLRSDFPYYAQRALQIRGKQGIGPLWLNRAQRHLHEQIEEQREGLGYVRVIGLKGRQQGFSTYVQGRFYWLVTGGWGRRAFILTHEDPATRNLFEMARRFHEHCPDALKPRAKRSSTTELYFDRLDSGYAVGTARTKATGRSGTYQLFHGSEVAHWPNQSDHMAGLGQAIPSGKAAEGTEIILESTANGVGEMFHEIWQAAERGQSEYRPVFVPWYWQEEYALEPPPGWEPDEEEAAYGGAYGLTPQQLYWRRRKIDDELAGETWLFRQEYPATPSEAFQSPNSRPLITPDTVAMARRTRGVPQGPRVMGVDVARQGQDRSAVALRQGRVASAVIARHDSDLMSVAGWVARLSQTHRPDAIHVDGSGGYGAAVVDRLRELGVPRVVEVQFGGQARDKDRYRDKRSEMWGEMAAWLTHGSPSLPDDDDLQTDLVAPEHGHDSSGRMWLERKEDMAKRGVASPDKGDALALTFAEPVRKQSRPAPKQRQFRPATAAGY